MKKLLITLTAVLTLMSCSKEEQAFQPLNSQELELIGDFEWRQSPYAGDYTSQCYISFVSFNIDRTTTEVRYNDECVSRTASGSFKIEGGYITINGIDYEIIETELVSGKVVFMMITNNSTQWTSNLMPI
jgi:hypothetical protein|tara:strand:+ start:495 stop:884 length:390 start_codon:yes stop_codon:yes gene_type:complete